MPKISGVSPARHSSPLLAKVAGGVALVVGAMAAQAQSSPPPSPLKPLTPSVATTVIGAPTWAELKPVQKQSLAPLAGAWNTLSDAHRRKWLALAQNYPSLAPAEQQKLHSRMAEWAALKPKDREQARLNFAETKKIAPSERAANWEAYQALSPEERKKLAAKAKPKPSGAAVAVRPVPMDKLAEVPKTRTAPDIKRPLVTNPQALNRKTLLPIQNAPAPQPATDSAPD